MTVYRREWPGADIRTSLAGFTPEKANNTQVEQNKNTAEKDERKLTPYNRTVQTVEPNKNNQPDRQPELQGEQTEERKSENRTETRSYSPDDLNLRQKQILMELKSRDSEVRNHEAAHLAAAGGVARGGAHMVYVTGPDGRRYAVGGEVSIDSAPVSGEPLKTILKAQVIRRAALAPLNPSPQDRRVAAGASRMEQMARIAQNKQEVAESKSMQKSEDDTSSAHMAPFQASSSYAATRLASDDYSQSIDLLA